MTQPDRPRNTPEGSSTTNVTVLRAGVNRQRATKSIETPSTPTERTVSAISTGSRSTGSRPTSRTAASDARRTRDASAPRRWLPAAILLVGGIGLGLWQAEVFRPATDELAALPAPAAGPVSGETTGVVARKPQEANLQDAKPQGVPRVFLPATPIPAPLGENPDALFRALADAVRAGRLSASEVGAAGQGNEPDHAMAYFSWLVSRFPQYPQLPEARSLVARAHLERAEAARLRGDWAEAEVHLQYAFLAYTAGDDGVSQ